MLSICVLVAETASRDAAAAWNTSGQSQTRSNAPPRQGSCATGMDKRTQSISVGPVTGTFCAEHEVASIEAT